MRSKPMPMFQLQPVSHLPQLNVLSCSHTLLQLALNKNNQKPVDAARCNNEKDMVQYLSKLEEEKQQKA